MIKDIKELNLKYGIKKSVNNFDKDTLRKYLQFRIYFLREELIELMLAYENNNSDEIVDALIDLIVVAIGTLDAFNIDIEKAWKEVHNANMSKELGVNKTRENLLNLPDLIKPKDWKAPSHIDNLGLLEKMNEQKT